MYQIVQESHCSAAVRANSRISSAKRRSSKNAMLSLSPRSKPHFRVSAFCLQADMPYCNTVQNKRGLNTHPSGVDGKRIVVAMFTLYSPKSSQVKACRPDQLVYNVKKTKSSFEPHPMTILKSLHNPVVKAFPNTISFQCCFPSVGRSSACPSSPDVPMQNPASPTFRRQGCNIRSELPYCLDACDRPRCQSSVVRQHLYFVVPPR